MWANDLEQIWPREGLIQIIENLTSSEGFSPKWPLFVAEPTLSLQVVVLRYFQLDLYPIYDFDVVRTEMLPEVVHVGEVHVTLDALERLVDVAVGILVVLVEMGFLPER